MLFMGQGAITVNDPEYSGLEVSPYDPTEYSLEEIDQALREGQLNADQALQLHQRGQDWQIEVRGNK
jgi:hypothetical protein